MALNAVELRSPLRRVVVVGGAGFIGSHFVGRLLDDDAVESVTVFDNFSSGREWHLEPHKGDKRLSVVRADIEDSKELCSSLEGNDTVIHLASNPDIAKAMTDPNVDFDQGTALTRYVLEAMRLTGCWRILYASGSGVYGELGELEAAENYGPMRPTSTYGASKLAGEALICSYCHMFELTGRAFRFGNVVGPRQTHGVGYDFVRRLIDDPGRLNVLGDGNQSKSYVYIDDIMEAVLAASTHGVDIYDVYNVATGDYVTVNEIAELAIEVIGLDPRSVKILHSGGDRGWKGDVPIVRINTAKIRAIGWSNEKTSREAICASMEHIAIDKLAGRFG